MFQALHVFFTEIQYLQIDLSENGTSNNKLVMFYPLNTVHLFCNKFFFVFEMV